MKTTDTPAMTYATDETKFNQALAHSRKVTTAIETQTGKMPWVSWLGLSVISLAASATFAATRKEKDFAGVVGALAPCFMLMGVYNKLVQIEKHLGLSESHDHEAEVPNSTSYLS